MKSFKKYIKDYEDVEKSINQLPKKFRKLAHGFHIKLEPGHTLPGDNSHVGVVMTNPKNQIKLATPWNYPREFTFFHEIGHLVFEKYVRGTDLEKKWKELCSKTKDKKKDEPPEELFCHAFAATYCKYPPKIHYHDEWVKFIKAL